MHEEKIMTDTEIENIREFSGIVKSIIREKTYNCYPDTDDGKFHEITELVDIAIQKYCATYKNKRRFEMEKILWTFGLSTEYKGKAVITKSNNFNDAMYYVYKKYGQENVAFNYIDKYHDIDEMIKKYHYEIIEEVKL